MTQKKSTKAVVVPTETMKNDAALMATWRRFLDYDQVSSDGKRSYARLREIVITLSLLTSAGAVFSIYLQQAEALWWLNVPTLQGGMRFLAETLRVLLIIMPIASVTLMRYASQFASSTSWIEYRVGAETLRSEIYLYRMRSGDYKNLNEVEARSKLLDTIEETNSRIDEQGATVPYMKNYQNILTLITNKTDSPELDDGIQELAVADYIDWRLKKQLSWYIEKIQRDYATLQREQTLALAVGAFGAVLSGLSQDLVALVAVTTAMGSALTARSETRMYGATYGIFHWTAGRLQNEMNQWEILPEVEKQKLSKQQEFVEEVEKIFQQERELWRAQAMQSQNNSDNSINNQLQQRVDRSDLEAHQQSGIIPVGIPDEDVEDDLVNYSTTQSMRVMRPVDVQQFNAAQSQITSGDTETPKLEPNSSSPIAEPSAPSPDFDESEFIVDSETEASDDDAAG